MSKNETNETPEKRIKNYINFLESQPKGFVYNDEPVKMVRQTHHERVHCTAHPALPTNPSAIVPQGRRLKAEKDGCESVDGFEQKINKSKQAKLDALKQQYTSCMQCPLATQGRAQVVFGTGNPDAQLMFVGEGPGRDEDKQGKPFVGRAGQLLTKIIEAMKLTRDDVYISNIVKCRPPENRAPLPNESEPCKNLMLFKEIEIIQPKIICALGATALQGLLGNGASISKVRGIFQDFNNILVMPTYHPAYLLRNPNAKREVWADMKTILEKLQTE